MMYIDCFELLTAFSAVEHLLGEVPVKVTDQWVFPATFWRALLFFDLVEGAPDPPCAGANSLQFSDTETTSSS